MSGFGQAHPDSGVGSQSAQCYVESTCEVPDSFRCAESRVIHSALLVCENTRRARPGPKGERRCVFQDVSRRGRARGSPQEERAARSQPAKHGETRAVFESRRYIAELNKPRIRLPSLVGFVAGAGVGHVVGRVTR
jgi:hypothetical protein